MFHATDFGRAKVHVCVYNGPSWPSSYNVIGASSWPGSSINAFVDELTICNRTLSVTEIQAIYNAGASGEYKH